MNSVGIFKEDEGTNGQEKRCHKPEGIAIVVYGEATPIKRMENAGFDS
jgi:hypothetical protein